MSQIDFAKWPEVTGTLSVPSKFEIATAVATFVLSILWDMVSVL